MAHQSREDAVDIDVARTEGDADIRPPLVEVGPARGLGPLEDGLVDILDVNVVDAIRPGMHALDGISSRQCHVADIQRQRDVGGGEKSVDLPCGFDVRRDVRVERRSQPVAAGKVDSAREPLARQIPLPVVQRERPIVTCRVDEELLGTLIGQDGERRPRGDQLTAGGVHAREIGFEDLIAQG